MTAGIRLASLLMCLSFATGVALAATATYDYDALGRLTGITYADGKAVIYQYDAAGNRTQVASGTLSSYACLNLAYFSSSKRALCQRVSINPGQTALTRTRLFAYSSAADRVKAFNPAFEAL